MVDDTDTQQRAARFAPRDRQAEPERQRVRASLLFLGLGILLTSGTILWLGLFNQQDEIRLEISDLTVDETGDVELTGAIYRGQTARGEPFEITADVARERRRCRPVVPNSTVATVERGYHGYQVDNRHLHACKDRNRAFRRCRDQKP